jgi:V8-like Glu-specific endopeptidase
VKVVVEIVSGARAGQSLEFANAQTIRLGRHPSNDVAFDPERDRDASSRHAELRNEANMIWVYDLNSANGTKVNGRAVSGKALVPPGAEVELGDGGPRCKVVYQAPGAEGTVPPTMFKKGAAAPVAPLPVGTKVGARTVAMMIQDALNRSGGSNKRLQVVAVGLGVALFLTLAGVVVAYKLRPPADVAIKREMVRVMEQQSRASADERAALQKKLDEMSARLAHTGGASGSSIAKANHDSIFLVTVKTGAAEEGFCTAFAVKADRLVTNAHCVAAAEDYKKRGGAIWVVQNGHPENRLPVERMRRITGFSLNSGGITPDVGWLKVGGDKPLKSLVSLAPAGEYQQLGTGDLMFTYGFPGRLSDAAAPEATFVEGVVGRITTIDGRVGDVKDTKLIQHSAFTSGGTSGSPIFDGVGHVVAVNTGAYAEATAGAGSQAVVSRSLPGYNFGMRVDLVEQLLSEEDE